MLTGACKCFTAPEEQDGNLVAPFPTFPLGFGDTGQEVVADLHEAGRAGPDPAPGGHSGAGVFMDARGAVGAGAGTDGELAAFEVAEEVLPLGVGGGRRGTPRPRAGCGGGR